MTNVKVNKLLSKKTKNEEEYWNNWLGMNELDRELYVTRLIPVLKRTMNDKNAISTATLLNSYFQDLEMTMKQNMKKYMVMKK
jgi:hypothetical protein